MTADVIYTKEDRPWERAHGIGESGYSYVGGNFGGSLTWKRTGYLPSLRPEINTLTNGFSLNWEADIHAANPAKRYQLYRRNVSEGSEWTAVGDPTADTHYTDLSVQSGVIYSYAVRSVFDDGQVSELSSPSVDRCFLTAPTITSASLLVDGIRINWSASAGATK